MIPFDIEVIIIFIIIIGIISLIYLNNTSENFSSNLLDNKKTEPETYKTNTGDTFIKSKIKTCDIVTSPETFPIGTTMKEALDICSKETSLGGHGQCIGILPFNKRNRMYGGDDTVYPWIGCISAAYYDDCPGDPINGGTWINIEKEDINNYQFA